MAKYTTNEYLLKNYIQKELQLYLLPLNFLQSMFCISKYTIRYNFITPNSVAYNIISFTCLCSVVSVHFYYYENIIIDGILRTPVLQLSIFINTFMHICLFFSTYILNWRHTEDNISIVLRIQDVFSTFKSCLKKGFYQNLIIWNWFYVIFVMTCYVIAMPLHFVFINYQLHPIAVILTIAHIFFDMSETYGIRIVNLILVEMQIWISEFEKLAQSKIGCANTGGCIDLLKSYTNILGAFEDFKKTLRVVLFLKTTGVFIQALIYIEIILEVLHLEAERSTMFLGLVSKVTLCANMLKNLGLFAHLCIECEMFYKYIQDVSALASVILNQEKCPGAVNHLCKNIIRLNSMFEKMTACYVFTVDAALPMRLLAVVTTYAVVLLQFNMKLLQCT